MNYNLFPSAEFKASWKKDTRSKDLKNKPINKTVYYEPNMEWKTRFLGVARGPYWDFNWWVRQTYPGSPWLYWSTAGHPCRAVHLLRFREQTRKQPQRWFDRDWAIQSHFPLPNSFIKQYTSLPQRRENGEWHCMRQAFLPKEKWWVGNTWSYEQFIEHRVSATEGLETRGDDRDSALRSLSPHGIWYK